MRPPSNAKSRYPSPTKVDFASDSSATAIRNRSASSRLLERLHAQGLMANSTICNCRQGQIEMSWRIADPSSTTDPQQYTFTKALETGERPSFRAARIFALPSGSASVLPMVCGRAARQKKTVDWLFCRKEPTWTFCRLPRRRRELRLRGRYGDAAHDAILILDTHDHGFRALTFDSLVKGGRGIDRRISDSQYPVSRPNAGSPSGRVRRYVQHRYLGREFPAAPNSEQRRVLKNCRTVVDNHAIPTAIGVQGISIACVEKRFLRDASLQLQFSHRPTCRPKDREKYRLSGESETKFAKQVIPAADVDAVHSSDDVIGLDLSHVPGQPRNHNANSGPLDSSLPIGPAKFFRLDPQEAVLRGVCLL